MRISVYPLLLSTFFLFSCSDTETTTLQEGDDCSSTTVLSGGQGSSADGICAEGLSCIDDICTLATNNGTNNATNNATTPSCNDGLLNQDETGVDCGGSTCERCHEGMGCSVSSDCLSTICLEGMCAAATCGDGIVNGPEDCDGDGAGAGGSTATCDVDCSPVECGDGLANTEAGEACDGDGAGTGGESATCNTDCSVAACGDGQVNAAALETCDGDGAGTGGETAVCNTDCTAAACGDGVVNTLAGEGCDDGNQVDDDACSNTCVAASCGDAVVNNGEACDDGNQDDLDACSNACVLAVCGDAVVNNGEACDDGNQVDDDACSNTCVLAVCGDAVVNNGEACDDGNQVDNDACSNACVIAVCGDAVVNNGEACDDGNQDDLDACSNTCVLAVCGDAVVNNGEACDDGNQIDDDACSNACIIAVCGDAIVNNGEACDDGNQVDDDVCSNTCVLAVCGDNIVNNGEACDDGNQVDDDACSNACVIAVCGDGIVNNGEACDDGNQVDNDVCSNACTLNPIGPRGTVALCGNSTRQLTEFVPPRFTIVNTCVPTNDMQAMIITRSGIAGLNTNAAAIQTYVQNGGKLLTEYTSSDEVFNVVFPETVTQGISGTGGACQDRMPTVVQFSPGDLFWAANTFTTIPSGETGCGRDISAFPGITALAGWSATQVSVGYRDFGAGRVWFTDYDWQDGENSATWGYTANLMGYMIDPRNIVALCGNSNRPVSTFVPAEFSIVNTCVPTDNMQAMLFSRTGLTGLTANAAAIQTYVQNGGKVLTEYSITDDVFNVVFPETVTQVPSQIGGCKDTFPTVVQFTAGDPFWADNTFTPIVMSDAGCGFEIAAYPGMTPLAGWSATQVSVGYRDFGAGRVWLTEFDWQDTNVSTAEFTYSGQLLGSMISN